MFPFSFIEYLYYHGITDIHNTTAKEKSIIRYYYYQWVLPITGKLELQIGNQTNKVNQNQGAFIRPHETHCFASYYENRFLVLDTKSSNSWLKNRDIPSFCELTPALQKYLQFTNTYLEEHKNDLVASVQ